VFVGRHAELASLAETLAARTACLVSGTAGVGKTALMHAATAGSGLRSFEGGGLATLSRVECLPLARALGRELPDAGAKAIATVVRERVGRGVLLVDDLQWVDDSTLAVLEHLVGELALLVAVRSDDPASGGVRARLRAVGVRELELGGIGDVEARAVLRDHSPLLDAQEVADAVARAHGNLVLLTTTRSATAALRLTLAAWLAPHPAAVRDAAARLALLGRPAPAATAGAGAGRLVKAGLAVRRGREIELAHPLIGEAALEDVGPQARRVLHAELARVLRDPGEAARHHAAAGCPRRAVELALRASRETSHAGERAVHLDLAATLVTGPDADALRLQAALALGEVGAHDAALAHADAVAPAGEAAVGACLAASRALFSLARVPEARARLADGIAGCDPADPQSADLRFELARMAGWEWDGERATAIGREILALGMGARADALGHYALGVGVFCAERSECVAHFATAATLAEQAGDAMLEMDARVSAASSAMEFSPALDALAALDATAERARALGVGTREVECRWLRHHVEAIRLGRFRAAADGCLELLRDPVALGPYADRVRGLLGYALAATGDDAGAIEVLDAAARLASTGDGHQWIAWARAEADWLAGRPAAAAGASSHADGRSQTMLVALRVTDGWAALELKASPPELPGAIGSPTGRGLREQLVGLRALAAGDAHGAEVAFAAGAAQLTQYHVADAVRCRWAAGRAALAQRESARAITYLLAAEGDAAAYGVVPLERRIVASLRAAGVLRAAARGRTGSVSRRESEVLELVGRGLTTHAISARLGIADSTVETLIRSAMRRLGARTRRQAALLAAAERRP
jgi:DNA-binding CsgD family transcriptional regulator